jgi:hypothetical protein
MIFEFLNWVYPRLLLTAGVFLLMCIINSLLKRSMNWKWNVGYSIGFFIGVILLLK